MELLLETGKKNNFTIFKPIGELNYEGALRLIPRLLRPG
jgi:hypothetical protein